MSSHDHWVPSKKFQLVVSLAEVYPGEVTKLAKMPKRQLYAIWFRLWEARGCRGCKRA